MAIKLIIDSASDIPQSEAKQLGMECLPMTVSFDGEIFRDGVDLTPNEFYEKLIETDNIPSTSQIPPVVYEEVCRKIIAEGDTPFIITISSALSGSYNSAVIAASEIEEDVYVVDSRNVALGEAILIRYALRRIGEGISAEDLEEELNEQKGRIKLLALLDTLEYLKKGGRISAAVAFAGGLLSIKPVIGIVDGAVELVGKARGSKNGNNLLVELVNKSNGIDFSMPYCLAYTGLTDTLLNKYIEDSKALWESHTDNIPVLQIGATIGTHAGPGAIAVAFFAKG